MKLVTKFDIGHTFWVPRSVKRVKQQLLSWEGEEWYRNIDIFVASAKKKKIIKIEISVHQNGTHCIMYGVINTDEEDKDQLMQFYQEDSISNYLQEEALSIAAEYAEQKKEYFGN